MHSRTNTTLAIIAAGRHRGGGWPIRSESMAPPGSRATVEAERVATIFAEFAASENLALRFPADGCYARAHVMVQRLLGLGLAPLKVWAFPGPKEKLWVDAPDHPDGRVKWNYHVAPALLVGGPEGELELVLDPVACDRPVPVQEWLAALHDTPRLVRTRPGEPPRPEAGGPGYWPIPDPPEGPDVHALETLEDYRRRTV
jgi:hypothetical protein